MFKKASDGKSASKWMFERLEKLCEGGAKFRCASDFAEVKESVLAAFDAFASRFADNENHGKAVAWVAAAKEQFEALLAQKKEEDTRTIQPFWKAVKHLQTNFVFCGCDKSPQTVACVCKKYYKQELRKKFESQAYAPASEDDVLKAAAAMKSEERNLDK